MPSQQDITLSEAAKLADLIRRDAEYEQGETADKEAKQEMGLMTDQPDKNPARSFQVWAAGIIAFLTTLVDEAWIQQHPEAILWVGYAIAALTLALRIKTRVPLRWRKPSKWTEEDAERRWELIAKEETRSISHADMAELEVLNATFRAYRRRYAPLPTPEEKAARAHIQTLVNPRGE